MAAPKHASPRESLESLEGAPLLSPSILDAPRLPDSSPKKKKPWVLLVVLIFILVAIVDVGAFLAEAPKTRVYEANICVRYYRDLDPSKILPDGTVDEEYCKEDKIQEKLASIFGWQDLFDSIPAILLAVPFGTLADKHGRKWVFAASLLGLQLNSAWILFICWFRSLPLQLTWLSSAFYLIGGGPIVAAAIGLTMLSDIVPAEKRTTVFLYVTASVMVAEMIAPILARILMERGDWYPLVLALAIQQVGVSIAALFPETLHLRDLPEPRDHERRNSVELHPPKTKIRQLFGFKAQVRHFKDALDFLRRDWQLALVIFTFFASRIGRQALSLIIRYASKRYHWKIADANLLLSFRAATNLVAITVFVPVVNIMLIKIARLQPHFADVWLARGSIMLTAFAFFLMGVAAHPAILIIGLLVFNLGTGYAAAMRSISIHIVGGQSSPDIGRLFAVIAIIESMGTMVAGPTLSGLFQWGIDHGEPLIGAPFFFAMFIFVAVTFITLMISAKDKEVIEYEEAAQEDEDDVGLEGLGAPIASGSALRRRSVEV
ncbi:major facilitator superfamily domain-containing protein [Lophiotrema nucula]|uniref:Major facilitator superfamily domain-containing protein n=1 Tax=Lophiotrema nucula TaxID=690887 RepID=A0A6A5YKJ2_9PLEO|nr:major facilitator superfamily domain-containing protein [Lophiotrema nucula]